MSTSLSTVPYPVLVEILAGLAPKDVANFRVASHLCRNANFWSELIRVSFGEKVKGNSAKDYAELYDIFAAQIYPFKFYDPKLSIIAKQLFEHMREIEIKAYQQKLPFRYYAEIQGNGTFFKARTIDGALLKMNEYHRNKRKDRDWFSDNIVEYYQGEITEDILADLHLDDLLQIPIDVLRRDYILKNDILDRNTDTSYNRLNDFLFIVYDKVTII